MNTKAEEKAGTEDIIGGRAAVAEAQVGPESEQVEGPKAVDSEPAKIFIPEEFRAEVLALAETKEEWRIRMKCAESRLNKAIEDGDAETAIVERRGLLNAEIAGIEAQDALWNRIREVTGGTYAAREWALNVKTGEVARRAFNPFDR